MVGIHNQEEMGISTKITDSSSRSLSGSVSESVVSSADDKKVESPSKNLLEPEAEAACSKETTEMMSPILEITRQNCGFMENPTTIQEAVHCLETELRNLRRICMKKCPNSLSLLEELNQDLSNLLAILPSSTTTIASVSLELKEKINYMHKKIMDSQPLPAKCYEEDDKEEEPEAVEQKLTTMNLDDILLQLKYGSEEEFKLALINLQTSIKLEKKIISHEWIIDERIIPVLFNRLGAHKCVQRLSIINLLRSITWENTQSKEKMADVNSLTTLVKSLARDPMERREAVGLLSELCQLSSVKRRIGKIKGCIFLLVAISNNGDDDPLAAQDAQNLLDALSNNTQNALLMAEAGYFTPLIHHLKQGSEMSKILMATSLSRTKLTDKTRASLGENGAIEPLVIMFKTGKLETKLSALTTLQNLSINKHNISLMITSGILSPLLQLLFSVTSSLMSLREPASALLARLAQSESVLVNKNIANQMLSLLNFSSLEIQSHLLEALHKITTHTNATKLRCQMKHNDVVQILLPFLTKCDSEVRINALKVLRNVTDDLPEDLGECLGENSTRIIINLISSSDSAIEREAAVGLLSNIPIGDKKVTEIFQSENLLPILLSIMNSSSSTSRVAKKTACTSLMMEESIASIIIRFTLPCDRKLQHYAVEVGIIPILLKLLSIGSVTSRSRAATSLSQLSQNSLCLRNPRSSNKWICYLPRFSGDTLCSVHKINCTVKGNFCLIKAGAVAPLIHALEDKERGADEAILGAISTLLKDGLWQDGSKLIVDLSGVDVIVNILEIGTLKAKEMALWILERIFGVEDYRVKNGEFAQRVLIDLAQTGDLSLKPRVGKLLAELEILNVQSTYF